MNNVYIVFRGVNWGDDQKEMESVHADIISAREAVEDILSECAKQGFIYTVPEHSNTRTWRYKNHFISIEIHPVQSSTKK